PQQHYQAYLGLLTAWQTTLATIEGSASSPESEKGLEARLAHLDSLPEQLEAKRGKRREITKSLHGVLDEQRASRAALFAFRARCR
ncbi:hypothetical protein ACCS78_40880, partial [Rhizobium johnstonii]